MKTSLKLTCSHLTVVSDNNQTLLHDIDFQSELSVATAILGESGSGKTILCRAIAEVLPTRVKITSGSIAVHNSIQTDESSRNDFPRIIMVPQLPASCLPPTLSVKELLEKAASWNCQDQLKNKRKNPLWPLEKLGLENDSFAGLYPHQLSGGIAQRVAIAAALVTQPDILILDEPTVGLDPANREILIQFFQSYNKKENGVILLVSHDIFLVKELCSTAVILRDSKLYAVGNLDELHDRYLDDLLSY